MMDNRDEQLTCADCGGSFVFTASEAAFYAEKGLTAPKRCKECRAARKQGGGGRGRGPSGRPPRYTGDVNEYRSPMQDNGYQPAPARRDGRAPRSDGNYRAPSFGGDAARRPRRPGGDAPRPGALPPRAQAAPAPSEPGAGTARRARRARPLFDITCSSCGASSQVPFEPIEGREVFCKDCYVARKPIV
jgi:CxxC-x17-CxxC domain-containing protein